MYGLKTDWSKKDNDRYCTLDDYTSLKARWCPGCGDHAVLAALQKLCRDEQLPPEKIVCVSGIGCSSRFPHYMKTYGFHGLHGRALPVAEGVRSRRPDLHVFVATGDGDCCSIGAGHWIHAIRYNMNMTVMLFDNNVYGLTKAQTSPTSPKGMKTNTHPNGSLMDPIDPIQTTLSVTNVSFVAQTVDWNPVHVYATLKAAHEHKGLSFVRIMQRCPHYTPGMWDGYIKDPMTVLMMKHDKGINADNLDRMFKNTIAHDPSDLDAARKLAARRDILPIGLYYQDASVDCYDEHSAVGVGMPRANRLEALRNELDRYRI